MRVPPYFLQVRLIWAVLHWTGTNNLQRVKTKVIQYADIDSISYLPLLCS